MPCCSYHLIEETQKCELNFDQIIAESKEEIWDDETCNESAGIFDGTSSTCVVILFSFKYLLIIL